MASDLKVIRAGFADDDAAWSDIREAGVEDVRALSPDSTWPDEDRKARKAAGRPCLSFDELGQYCNTLVNDARETKRAIEVNPQGDETSEAQARLIGALIRQIEYRSVAQMAYTRMFEDAVQRGYGFCRVIARYIQQKVNEPSAQSFDQELIILPVPNPDLVTPGYFTKPDFSDCRRFWVHESYEHEDFHRRFPKASPMTREAIRDVGPRWADDKRVWVRELWELKTKQATLLLFEGKDGQPAAFWEADVPKGQRDKAIRERVVEQPYVCQTITNGVDILQKNEDWPGQYLPIIGCVGKVLWLEDERQILSLIRNARGPQQLFNYYRTSEAEMVGMAPKFPWFYYDGMDPEEAAKLAVANQTPQGAIKINPNPDGWNPAWGPMPFPQRNPWEPPIQAFEVGAESTRRSIQSATGTGFLPTDAQRVNQKSGIALRQIETSAQKGSYHFVDHYEHAIRRVGEVLVDLIPHYYDAARTIHVRTPDDKTLQVRINDPNAAPPAEFAKSYGDQPLMTTTGAFDVTISTGPSYASEREKASEFADQLVAARPEVFALIGPEIIRLKNLGPIGEKIAEVLEVMQPPQIQQLKQGQQPLPPQAQQAMAQLQQAQQMIQQLQRVIETEQVKGQTQMQIRQIDGQIKLALQKLKGEQDIEKLRLETSVDIDTREDEQAHELAMKGADAAQSEASAARAAEQAYLTNGSGKPAPGRSA